MSELQILRILADSDKIQLLTSLLEQAEHGIRVGPSRRGAESVERIEIDLHALGSALQHADLLGPEFESSVPILESLFRARVDCVRKASQPRWEDGMHRYCFLLGSNSPAEEIGSMISTAMKAWEGEHTETPMRTLHATSFLMLQKRNRVPPQPGLHLALQSEM